MTVHFTHGMNKSQSAINISLITFLYAVIIG